MFWHALLSSFKDTQVIGVSEIGETLAYTWFGRPNYAYSESAQKYWIGSTKDTISGTTQHITEYNITNDTYTTTQVGTSFQKDDHNQTQILIRQSDNRLMAVYAEHNNNNLIRYRISTNPLDSTSWGAETTINTGFNVSYPSPYQASNGDIYIFYREAGAWWAYRKSTDNGVTFGSRIELWTNAMKAYLVSHQDGDKVHFIASDGHPQSNPTISLAVYHFYIDLLTGIYYNSEDVVISADTVSSTSTLIYQTTGDDTLWCLDISVKNNIPRVLYVVYPNGKINDWFTKDLWFAEWDGISWVSKKITTTLYGYIEDDIPNEKSYPASSRFDTSNPDIIWMPKQVDGILEIHKVDMSTTLPSITQITFDSTVNNWRPISIPSPVNNVLWLKNNSYNMYNDYSITLQTKTIQ